MNRITKYHKRVKITFVVAALLCSLIFMFIFDTHYAEAGQIGYYVVKVGDTIVGTSNSEKKAEEALSEARIMLSQKADSIVYVNTELSLEGEKRLFANTDSLETLTNSIYDHLEEKVNLDYAQGYMIASGEYTIIVDSIDSVAAVLETLENSYDANGKYSVALESIGNGNFTGISYDISKVADADYGQNAKEKDTLTVSEDQNQNKDQDQNKDQGQDQDNQAAGKKSADTIRNNASTVMANADDKAAADEDTAADTHNLEAIGFTDDLKIHAVYVDSEIILTADEAIKQLEEDGAEAIGVVMTEVTNYDEKYYAESVYVEDNTMYEGENKVVQEAVPGLRNVTARINYVNGWESSREYLDEQIVKEAVPEIIHVGTQSAPTFVVPLDGVFTSGFGARWGTVHEGNDYGCSYASPIWASCGGTVIRSGWNDFGYGYMVDIDHGNGMMTRYAHMSQVACYVGQKVKQFEVIGYAGNTGNSFGVHCHFEIRINDIAQDPFIYLN